MGWTLNDSASYSAWSEDTLTTVGTVDVNSGDLIVVIAGTSSDTTYPNAITGEDESFTLRTLLQAAGYCSLLLGYIINASANVANSIEIGFNNTTNTKKSVVIFVFTPTSGEVTLDDQGWTKESTLWEASPWETSSASNTGTDTIAVAGFCSPFSVTFSNPEIPSGTAADGSLYIGSVVAGLYRSLTSTGSIEAEIDVSANNRNASEMLCFNIAAAGTASPNVAQSVNLTESISLALELLNLSVDLSETLNLTESIAMQMPLGAVSVYDGFDLTEALTPGIPLDLSRFDQLTVSEFLGLLVNIAPSVFEDITVTEFIALLKDIKFDVAETINIIEYVDTLLSVSGVDFYDTLTVAEYVDLLLTSDFGLVENENINLSEVVNAILSVAGIDTAQVINISEFVSAALQLPSVAGDETVTVAEFVSTLLSISGVDVLQVVTVAEFVNMSLSAAGAYQISVSEIAVISEVVSAILSVAGVSATETVQVVESVVAQLPLALTVFDLVQISEYVRAELEESGLSVSDSLTVAEFAAVLVTQYMAVVDETITIAEYINVVVESLVRGEVGISWSIQRPKVAFSIKRPKINFTF